MKILKTYINNVKECYKHIPYTWKHKIAFIQVEKRLTGKIRFKSYFHDMDKVILFVLSPLCGYHEWTINKFHRNHSTHHDVIGTDYLSMMIDWECARFTKPDKPLNARETMEKYYPNLRGNIEPLLEKYNL